VKLGSSAFCTNLWVLIDEAEAEIFSLVGRRVGVVGERLRSRTLYQMPGGVTLPRVIRIRRKQIRQLSNCHATQTTAPSIKSMRSQSIISFLSSCNVMSAFELVNGVGAKPSIHITPLRSCLYPCPASVRVLPCEKSMTGKTGRRGNVLCRWALAHIGQVEFSFASKQCIASMMWRFPIQSPHQNRVLD